MKETGTIKVEKRIDTNRRLSKHLRETGLIPGNVSGKGMQSISVIVKKDELKKTIVKYGRNAVYKLNIDDSEDHSVIVKEIQYGPVNREVLHVDFQQVSFSEEIKADVAVRIIGREQIEMKKLLLLHHIDILPVKGFPQNLPEVIEADVSELQAGDNLYVKDLKLPEGITLEIDEEQLVVSIAEPKGAAVDEEAAEEVAAEE